MHWLSSCLLLGVLSCSVAQDVPSRPTRALQQTHRTHRTLVVFPCISKSHSLLGNRLVELLLEDGHEVTYITPYPPNNDNVKLNVIPVPGIVEIVPDDNLNIEMYMKGAATISYAELYTMSANITIKLFEQPGVKELLLDGKAHYDVVIAEWMYNELLASFAALFECPMIWLNTMYPHWVVSQLVDGVLNPAFSTDILSPALPPLNFFERVQELYTQLFTQIYVEITIKPWINTFYRYILGPIFTKRGLAIPEYQELVYNASLVLGNSHTTTGAAPALPQSYRLIGGYHVHDTPPALPKNIQDIMDTAKHGVIYFSMGSNLNSAGFPDSLKLDLLDMFASLPQTVIWKFEEEIPNLPINLHIVKWAPQQSVLAHPNCILFISHAGLLSTTEAVHYGVPLIGIPVFIDQMRNIAAAVRNGIAKEVSLMKPNMVEQLRLSIEEIVHESVYTEKAKQLSAVYHSRPLPPSKELVFWVNHVITHGAGHLRSVAIDVPLYKKHYFDLIALLLVATYLIYKYIRSKLTKKKLYTHRSFKKHN